MAVEIYLEPELEEMIHSNQLNDEWKDKINELGLEGQQNLLKDDKSNPSPYTFMNQNMVKIFATVCPEVIDYKQYSKSTIPMEVLSHIALCEKEGYFKYMKIWYDDISPDPILVGYLKDGEYSMTQHLIARWGDEVIPIEMIESKAKQRIKDLLTSKLNSIMTSIDGEIFDFFNPAKFSNNKLGFEYNPVTYSHTN